MFCASDRNYPNICEQNHQNELIIIKTITTNITSAFKIIEKSTRLHVHHVGMVLVYVKCVITWNFQIRRGMTSNNCLGIVCSHNFSHILTSFNLRRQALTTTLIFRPYKRYIELYTLCNICEKNI